LLAALLTAIPATDLEVVDDVGEPSPGPGEVVIELDACGICGTDLEIMAGNSYRPDLPFILGHEPVGRVIEDAEESWLGKRVTMSLFGGEREHCQVCLEHPDWPTPCRVGDERLCYGATEVLGVAGRPGAFAERTSARAELLVGVPEELSSAEAASLVDAGATAANAARQVDPEDPRPVAVIGGGPLGFFAAQLLSGDHDVTVVEPLAGRREQVAELGLDAVDVMATLTGPFGAVLDCAGAPEVMAAGLDLLGPRGLFVVVGYGRVSIDSAPIARKELRVAGVRSGDPDDLRGILGKAAQGEFRLPEIRSWVLPEINQAFADLRQGVVPGKAVIVPH
jgi:D-arabinose 1-dehydrogenase-like Zn-dependent alcohol dehydrogenase